MEQYTREDDLPHEAAVRRAEQAAAKAAAEAEREAMASAADEVARTFERRANSDDDQWLLYGVVSNAFSDFAEAIRRRGT